MRFSNAEGEIDVITFMLLREAVGRALTGGATPLRVDLSEMTFIDSTGFATLAELAATNAKLQFVRLSAQVRRVAEIAGLKGELRFLEERFLA